MVSLTLGKASPVTELAAAPLMANVGAIEFSPNSIFLNRAKQDSGWLTPTYAPWPTINLTTAKEIASLPSGVTSALRLLFRLPTTTAADIASINAVEAGQFRLTWTGGPTTCGLTGATVDSAGTRSVTFTIAGINNTTATFSSLDTLGVPSALVVVRVVDLALYDAGEIFDPDFLTPLTAAKYEALRFMEWGDINYSPEINWADRAIVGSATWQVCPVEIMVALCNKLG